MEPGDGKRVHNSKMSLVTDCSKLLLLLLRGMLKLLSKFVLTMKKVWKVR